MSRFDLTREELAILLAEEPPYRVAQVWEGLHRRHSEPPELTELPRRLRARLTGDPAFALAWQLVDESVSDSGKTRKWLLEADDASRVEAVLMKYRARTTVCVSSQAGCAMGCSFCATGQLGFGRHLTTGEIVEQVVRSARFVADAGWGRLGNIVFMGMGEPLANYANVLAAIQRCNGDLGIAARAITVSTVGVVPGIRRLAGEPLQINLAVSLHAANDTLRSELVPLNRRYGLDVLMSACAEYFEATGRRISFEWACIAGVNDRRDDARELAELARPLHAHVNLIPLNPTPGYLVAGSSAPAVAGFRERLFDLGVNATIRDTRGREVGGACGQLAAGLAPGGLGRSGARSAKVAVLSSPRVASSR